ncbi:DNA replication complex GINS protein PSF2-like [Zophobas morio]|jgi:GINS complex subunit 2|uniref:DNA replication complex GINS protein PSF2-like n=1 Tax=Zophobas morio TaxID=2755281 RepID=UPI00308274FB
MDSLSEFTASEIEFFAEDEGITIVPNFRLEKLSLIRKDYGPFEPSLPVEVPLWLAMNLKKRSRCRIVSPPWLNTEFLTKKIEEEQEKEQLSELPAYALEIGMRVLKYAPDDISNATQTRISLEKLWETRLAKLKKSLHEISDPTALKLKNISHMEINYWRSFLTHSMDYFYEMTEANL